MRISNLLRFVKTDTGIQLLLCLLVFSICAWHIPNRTSSPMQADEIAQFAIAGYVAGYDWSSLISGIGYYQFGYSLVFILPFFWLLGSDMQAIYHGTLVSNSLLAAGTVPLAYYILRQWGMKSFRENIALIPAVLLSSLSACIVAYASLGLAEVLLVFLGFLLTALILRMQTKPPGHFAVVLLAFLLIYGFSVHMRFLGVVFAGILVFVFMVCTKKIEKKFLISFFLTLGASLTISLLLRQYFLTNLWLEHDAGVISSGAPNDISRSFRAVNRLTSVSGITAFIKAAGGQLWYLGVATFLLIYVGLYDILVDYYHKVKVFFKQKYANFDFSVIFMILGFIATLFISSLFMIGGGRGTAFGGAVFVYGRYNVILFLPMQMYAIASILARNETVSQTAQLSAAAHSKKITNIGLVIIMLCFLLLSAFVISHHNEYYIGKPFNYLNTVSLYLLEDFPRNSIVSAVGFALILFCCYSRNKKKLLTIVLSAMLLFNIATGCRTITNVIMDPWDNLVRFHELPEVRKENEVYFYSRTNSIPLQLFCVQMAAPETKIVIIDDVGQIHNTNNLLLLNLLADDDDASQIDTIESYEFKDILFVTQYSITD